ncbi:Fic family protein [Collinsella tanakaei]|uniref:Fic family protein n=1 Tax=Collinsella tanakaei TaxID=626935 RepID=UPI00195E74ED|nr:Fic family protein [Collinsella tanakaei]MBM6779148.1 Fic family protein [Collinsella tanakaei]
MAYEPPFEQTTEISNLCMEIAELVGMIHPTSELSTSPTLHRELRIRTIRSSLMIEGNTLSEEAVTAIMDGKRALGPAKDILEVKNAQRAYALAPSLDPYSVEDFLRAHREMMEGLVEGAGCFRAKNAGVFDGTELIHAGTPAGYVPSVIADLFAWLASTDLHPLLSSCIFHYEFEFIHPFADGNGRTGRLWHTMLLARWRPALAWLPVESVIRERQQDYYAALAQSNRDGSSEAFVTFMLRVIRDALRPFATPEEKRRERGQRALSYFAAHPKGTVPELADELGCSKRSAERIVAKLREDGLLVREGSARGGRWVVPGRPDGADAL